MKKKGFTEEEREAMREHAREARSSKADGEADRLNAPLPELVSLRRKSRLDRARLGCERVASPSPPSPISITLPPKWQRPTWSPPSSF